MTLPLWKGGSEVVFDMYTATVIWDGQIQVIDVAASEADPLIGMSMLYGFKLLIEAIEGGTVRDLRGNNIPAICGFRFRLRSILGG